MMFNTIFFEMALLATRNWNSLITVVQGPPLFGIVISFIGDRTTKEMRVKHTMWALEEMFEIFVKNGRYAPGSVVVDITHTRLGVGSVQPARSIQATSSQIDGPFNTTAPRTSIVLDMNSSLSLNNQRNASATTASPPIPNNLLSDFISLDLSNPEKIRLEIHYRLGGFSFDSTQIYNATLKLLIRTAEPTDRDASIGPILSAYNDVENFTISLVSNPFVKSTALSWVDCIRTINALVGEMWTQVLGGRWAELDGIIWDGTLNVGRLCIDRGDLTSLNPETVCTAPLESASVLRV